MQKIVLGALFLLAPLLVNGCGHQGGDQSAGEHSTAIEIRTSNLLPGETQVASVVAGDQHTCALMTDGTVQCWGWNALGQLGDGNVAETDSSIPTPVVGLSGVVSLAAGYGHTCAALTNGTVKCWGWNPDGELGNGTGPDVPTPTTVAGLSGVVSIAASGFHTCAAISDGTVACWGYIGAATDSQTPVVVPGLSGVVSLAAGYEHACAALAGGTVECWGLNGEGELGDGTVTDSSTPTPVVGLSGVVSLAAGNFQTCASTADGTVQCWGSNAYGQLGNGTFMDSPVPISPTGLSGVVSFGGGLVHMCAVLTDGSVDCWGGNSDGQLGNGTEVISSTPTKAIGLSGVVSMAAGQNHTCVVLTNGSVKCWGWNAYGQLGDGSATDILTPTAVVGLTNVASLAGGEVNVCGAMTDGSAKCWGRNFFGQLGDGTLADSAEPTTVGGLSGVVALAAGFSHSCAVLTNGSVKCWGDNTRGELGNGTITPDTTPPAPTVPGSVVGLSGVVSLTAGLDHTCAVMTDGSAKCWGWNVFGQLGDGTGIDSPTPVGVTGLSGVVSMAAGRYHTCAVLSNGSASCWGEGAYGKLGNGTTAGSRGPTPVIGLSGVVSIAAGEDHNCAILTDGTAKCWGYNAYGQLGDGTTTDSFTPVAVAGLSGATSIAAGALHTCAVLADGSAKCWGSNYFGYFGSDWGPFGHDAATALPTPTTVPGLSGAVSVTAGRVYTCALMKDASVECWGHANYGEAGDGIPPFSSTATSVVGLGLNGYPCAITADCASKFCVDGVCCADACGGGDPSDCQACSVAAGGTSDGTCVALLTTHACRPSTGVCDVSEFCDGSSLTCPADGFAPATTVCQAPTSLCTLPALCSGGGPVCPAPATLPGCTQVPLADCSAPSCPGETVNLDGGTGTVGGATVTFTGVTSPGEIAVVAMGTGPPPPTGYQILNSGVPHYWDINTTATYSGAITVCLHYDQSWVTSSESSLRLVHDDGLHTCNGSAFCNITISLDTTNNVICGTTTSLSPFAIIEPIDTTAPVFSGVPGTVVAYATSVSGVKVTYTTPTATDAVDGVRPVTCTPASGSMFAPGETAVTCTASDTHGNSATVAFAVWVQYQAPCDGTFFLPPVRPSGTSIFVVGRPVPVRFKLTGASAGITNLVAKLTVTKISGAILGTVVDVSDETVDDTGLTFVYRPLLQWYAYRWKTSDQTQGTYQIKADLGDGVVHQITVSLKLSR